MRLRALASLLAVTVSAADTSADRAAAITQAHIDALGGRARIEALTAFRATGHVRGPGGPASPFTLTAARPNRVRMELRQPDHVLVQATDGVNPPWEQKTGQASGPRTLMPAAEAKAFLADAAFDDPLVAGASQGFQVTFTGDATVENRTFLSLKVTKLDTPAFILLVDPATHLVVVRIDPPEGKNPGSIVTRYSDFRPVAGVVVPHEITVLENGHLVQQARIDSIEPNPTLAPEAFTRP